MSRRENILALRRTAPVILPSILRCDFGDLRHELASLQATGVPALHLDIMDGQFVPNLSFGIPVVEGIRQRWNGPLDTHLMIASPEKYAEAFYQAGADAITIHIEAVPDPVAVLRSIRELGAAAGIALNPGTPISRLKSCVGHCDLVLVMSVEAGFGGQSFQPIAIDKLRQAREMFGPEVLLEVDGGVNVHTIGQCVAAGAELLVIGSAISGKPDYAVAVNSLQTAIASRQSSLP